MGAESHSVQITSLKVAQLAVCLMLHLCTVVCFHPGHSTARQKGDTQGTLAPDSVLYDLF